MVTLSRRDSIPAKSLKWFRRRFKISTCATCTMALGILGLLSEPIWHFHRYKQSQKIIDRFTHFRSATLATRNGLLPRHHLRSQFWHNVDPLLEATKNKNATLEYDKKASHPRVLLLHFDSKTLEGSYSRQENRHDPRLVQPIGNSSCCGDDTDNHILPFSRRFYEDCVPIIRPRVITWYRILPKPYISLFSTIT